MRNPNTIEKEESLGNVVKVQKVIDFMVLGVLQQAGEQYNNQMEQFIIHKLDGIGVNNAYLTTRLQILFDLGHVTRRWDGDNRFNRIYKITDNGKFYFQQLLRELPDRVHLAQKAYNRFDSYIKEFSGH